MKLVEMVKDMRPYQAGGDAYLPDALADQLIASGDAINPRVLVPATPEAPAVPEPAKPRRQFYKTKAA